MKSQNKIMDEIWQSLFSIILLVSLKLTKTGVFGSLKKVDASDLKSDGAQTSCQFKSGPGQIKKTAIAVFFICLI